MTTKSKVTEAALAGEELPEGVVVGEAVATVLPKVKQIVRYLSKGYSDPQQDHFSVQEVDDYISFWINQGYGLFNTHYLGETIEGFGVMYILVLKE